MGSLTNADTFYLDRIFPKEQGHAALVQFAPAE